MFLTNIEISTITNGLRYIKAQVVSSYNTRNVPQYGPAGLDSAPVKNTLAVTTPTAARGADIVLGYQNLNQVALPGETILYSCDADGVYKATATMRVDGTIELLGTGDFLVRYTALDTALQQQVTDINNQLIAIAAAINAIVPGSYTPVPIVLNTIPAKITEIKTTAT